jgi:hypothetical protein
MTAGELTQSRVAKTVVSLANFPRRNPRFDDAVCEGGRYCDLVSEEAKKMFRAIVERYAAEGRPDRITYRFDAGAMTDTHRELEGAGLIQRVFGVPGGVCWRLTEAGVEQAK